MVTILEFINGKEIIALARGNPYKNDGSRKRDKREQRIIDNDL
jgi:hypothetical protein